MLSLLITALALGQAGVGSWPDRCRDRSSSRTRTCESYAQFEFAPADGAGMGSPCACTTPTGAKGETLTFTRGSSGTCLKGGTVSGIANGDMVTCSTNQARVMPGGSGTGPLGLLHEETRTNLLLRSQEFDNAAWNKANCDGTPGAPTVTADQAVAPDGTTTAERIQVPATSAAQSSCVYQTATEAGAYSGSLWLKGNAQTSTVHLAIFDNAASVYRCVTCSYNPTTWTRCLKENVAQGATNATFIFGNLGSASPFCGDGAQGAKDFFAWGGQSEVGASASSYIATAGATGTRSSEQLTYLAYSGPSLTNGSMAATVVCGDTLCGGAGEHGIVSLQIGSSYDHLLLVQTGSSNLIFYASSGSVAAGASVTANAPMRAAASWTGTSGTATWNGASASGSVAAIGAVNRFGFGAYNATLALINGVVKQVCLDSSPTRCR